MSGSRADRGPRVWSAGRELAAATLGGLALAVALTWPTLRHPATTIPQDPYDPLLETWSIAWGGHGLLTQPTQLFDANAFWPLQNSYAFTETLLGYAPLAWLGSGPTAALVHYNVLYVLVAALAFIGAYALARQLGAGPLGAVVAGAAFAYAPWRLAQAGHLHVLSTGGVPLALALLLRGHGYGAAGCRPERVRARLAVAGWLVAAWQLTIGFTVGLPFAYLLALLGLLAAAGWLVTGRPPVPRGLLAADAVGAAAFVGMGLAMARPYLQVASEHPEAARSLGDVSLFSPPLRGFLLAPDTSWLWGGIDAGARAGLPFAPEMTLLPGVVVIALALTGLVLSSWSPWRRAGLAAVVVVTVVLGMGTRFPGGGEWTYVPLRHLPGWDALRTPGRLVIFTTLALGLLAAAAVTELARRSRAWPRPAALALAVLPALVLVEGLGRTPHPAVPEVPAALGEVRGPVLVLPTSSLADNRAMYWSIDGFYPLVNGNSGFVPRELADLRARAAGFPDAGSVAYLREYGVREVVLLPRYAAGTAWEGAARRSVAGLGITRHQVGAAWVYDLS